MVDEIQKESTRFFYISLAFISVRCASIAITQPAEVIRINEQKNFSPSTLQTFKNLYKTGGIKGFYTGTAASFFKTAMKESYRGPAMAYLPILLENNSLTNKFNNNIINSTFFITAFCFLDTIMSSPIDRIKMLQITQPGYRGLKDILGNNLYAGFTKIYLHNLLSWGSFFIVDDAIKRRFYNKDKQRYHYFSNLATGGVVGFINTPLSLAVTHYTKHNPLTNVSIFSFYKDIVSKQGFSSVFCGWKTRVFQSIIGGTITSLLRDWSSKEVAKRP